MTWSNQQCLAPLLVDVPAEGECWSEKISISQLYFVLRGGGEWYVSSMRLTS